MSKILSIGITSYKRVNELVRCINSIGTKYVDDIEILVSEDHSPQSAQLKAEVEKMKESSPYDIRFTTNEVNLGYDRNLGAIIQKCRGDYIFFMSDDDIVFEGCIDRLIPILKQNGEKCGVLYGPVIYSRDKTRDRVRSCNGYISAGEENAAKYVYDSILFSGLIFKKKFVQDFDASQFVNYNYFQVYLFLQMMFRYGAYYINEPMVVCVGDGENAYGISDSSGGNQLLANRKSVKSNLEFNRTLIKTIRKFDEETGCHIIKAFEKQYSLHSYSGLSMAREEGIKYFEEYWDMLKKLDMRMYPVSYAYYLILRIFGTKKAEILMSKLRKLVKKE